MNAWIDTNDEFMAPPPTAPIATAVEVPPDFNHANISISESAFEGIFSKY